MSRAKLIIFLALIFLTVLVYPFLRIKNERDLKEIQKITKAIRICNGKYHLDYFEYVVEIGMYSDILSLSVNEWWSSLENIPFYLKYAGVMSLIGEVGYSKWLLFDSWHLLYIYSSQYSDCGGFNFSNTEKNKSLFKKGDIIQFY